ELSSATCSSLSQADIPYTWRQFGLLAILVQAFINVLIVNASPTSTMDDWLAISKPNIPTNSRSRCKNLRTPTHAIPPRQRRLALSQEHLKGWYHSHGRSHLSKHG